MVAGKSNPQALARAAGAPKLPPLPKLRVRKPNSTDTNPCIGFMSSMLGTRVPRGQQDVVMVGIGAILGERESMLIDGLDRLLGIARIQCARVCHARAAITSVYGCTGKFCIPLLRTRYLRADCGAQKPTETKKNNINYHLSRFYPQIIGPHKRK